VYPYAIVFVFLLIFVLISLLLPSNIIIFFKRSSLIVHMTFDINIKTYGNSRKAKSATGVKIYISQCSLDKG